MGHSDTQPWTTIEGRYLSITSFRRDGTPVATPVWFVQDGARLLVQTDADSYKVRRIRRNPQGSVAVCNSAGHLRGQSVAATAEVLPAADLARVEKFAYTARGTLASITDGTTTTSTFDAHGQTITRGSQT
jgi:PPOX class probable F420-dependent enzyme